MTESKATLNWQKFSFLEQITVEMTHVVDGRQFYMRVLDKNASYAKIDKLMSKLDANSAEEIQKPVLKGTLCAVKNRADGKWYRSKVLATLGKGFMQVMFIDYGMVGEVNVDDSTHIRKLPANALQFEP